jgi:hypothetical protein
MDALCLLVAGVVAGSMPGAEFTLAWSHSVQKSHWEERYRVEGGTLRLVAASVEGSGAGMEPPPEAQRDGLAWRWRPDRLVPAVVLAASGHGGDYTICSGALCRPLRSLVAADGPVELRSCAAR